MSMIRVQIPATCANLGPGLFGTALALRMHNTVDVSELDMGFKVHVASADGYSASEQDIAGFVLAALERYFRHIQRSPSGLDIVIGQAIPADSGLGSERAIELACLLGVNLLLGNPLSREDLIQLVARTRRDASAMIAAVWGGLISTGLMENEIIYESLPIKVSHVGVVFPHSRATKLQFLDAGEITIEDARTLSRGQTLILHALATGDMKLLSSAIHRVRYHEYVMPRHDAYKDAVSVGESWRDAAVSVSGVGPALIVFAENNLDDVVQDVRLAVRRGTQSEVSSWILPVDTQGVTISEMGGGIGHRTTPIPVDEHRRPAEQ